MLIRRAPPIYGGKSAGFAQSLPALRIRTMEKSSRIQSGRGGQLELITGCVTLRECDLLGGA